LFVYAGCNNMRYRTQSLFNFICVTFGIYALRLMKQWTKQSKSVVKHEFRIKFLKFCLEQSIIPRHLCRFHNYKINITHPNSYKRYKKVKKHTINNILKIELNDSFRALHHSRTQILHLVRQISRHIPITICNSFFTKQDKYLRFFAEREKHSFDQKTKWLLEKSKKESIQHIKPVKYYCSFPMTNTCSSDNNILKNSDFPLISFTPPFQPDQQTIEVNINPSTFPTDYNSSLTAIKKNWFLNLSSIDIPFEVQCLLQLGQNFSLPTLNIKYNALELIKNIENNIKKLNIDIQSNIRNHTIPIILKLFTRPPQNNNN